MTSNSDRLGPLTHSFFPDRLNLYAGFILSLLLGGGAVAGWLVAGDGATPDQRFWFWVGVASAIAAVVCLAFTALLARRKIALCEPGFRYRSFFTEVEVPWTAVTAIRHNVVPDRPNADSVTIRATGGKTFGFTANSVHDFSAFLAALKGHTSRTRWLVLSENANERWWILVLLGAILALAGAGSFVTISVAEARTSIEPVRLHWLIYLLYQIGGKWFALGALLTASAYFVVKGLSKRFTEASREVEIETSPPSPLSEAERGS